MDAYRMDEELATAINVLEGMLREDQDEVWGVETAEDQDRMWDNKIKCGMIYHQKF